MKCFGSVILDRTGRLANSPGFRSRNSESRQGLTSYRPVRESVSTSAAYIRQIFRRRSVSPRCSGFRRLSSIPRMTRLPLGYWHSAKPAQRRARRFYGKRELQRTSSVRRGSRHHRRLDDDRDPVSQVRKSTPARSVRTLENVPKTIRRRLGAKASPMMMARIVRVTISAAPFGRDSISAL